MGKIGLKAKDLGEWKIIDIIRKNTKTSTKDHLTDDCAVIDFKGVYLLATSDMGFEKSDFPPFATPEQVGKIFISMTLSDIAAMGGKPIGVLTALGIPEDMEKNYIERLVKSFDKNARKFGAEIVGGDVNDSEIFTICGSAIGYCEKDKCLLRSGAKIGDYIGVVDYVGDYVAAYNAFDKNLELDSASKRYLLRKLLEAEPQIEIGIEFAESKSVNSCIDLNDGLERGLKEIAIASKKDLLVYEDKIPISKSAKKVAEKLRCSYSDMSLGFSGDLNLLVTFPKKYLKKLSDIVTSYGKDFFVIGEVIGNGNNVYISKNNKKEILKKSSYEHYKTKQLYSDPKWKNMEI